MDREQLHECSTEELADSIAQLHGLSMAVQTAMLEQIAAFDDQEGWRADGACSMAEWMALRLGVNSRTAKAWARMARALAELPAIAAAASEGRFSLDQLAALTELATPDDEADLAEEAQGRSAAQLEAAARRARRIGRTETDEADRRRDLRWWWEESSLRLSGRLRHDQGAVLVKALARLADQAPADPVTGLFEAYGSRCADALTELASVRLADDADADRATVVVHVDADVLSGGDGVAELEDGPALSGATAHRLACDARLQMVADGRDGSPVGIGRVSRTVPPWLMRQLRRRDGGCCFPACGRTRWLHAHHRRHWADGGGTDLANLELTCGHHHRLLHEGGWKLERGPDGERRFIRPDGRVLADHPPPLRPDLRQRVLGTSAA